MGSSTLARLTRRLLALSAAAAVVTGPVLPGTASATPITLAPGDVTFEQWSRDNTPGWTTGNVGKNYTEGEVIPFRLTVSNAGNTPAGDSFVFSICRDFEEPAAPATVLRNGYLRLETYDTTVAAGLEGATVGNTVNGVTGAGEGATVDILSVADDTTPATGDCDPGQRETEVEFTVSGLDGSDEAYVLWGGRLASPFDAEVAPRDGATAYHGSSLHMTFFPSKTLSANASQIDAALPPAQLTVTKTIDNRDGGTGVIADFDLLVDGVERAWGTPITLPAGTYTVSEGPHAGYVSTIGGDCAANGAITLTAGQVAECLITNDDIADDDNPGGDDDPEDNPGGDDDSGEPGTDPTPEPEVESANQTNNPPVQPVQPAQPAQTVQTVPAPVSALPTTGSSPAPEPPAAPTLASELPRTGAGIREQSLLALALLAGGLLSSVLGRRRTRPRHVSQRHFQPH